MLTIKDVLKDVPEAGEEALAELSDRLWELGNLEEIKEKVSPELFLLHIGTNMIGNWKCDGWWELISSHAELIPFIPQALEAFGLYEVKTAFENVIALFPEYTVFSNEESSYYDIINFLQNVRFQVSDERLNAVAPEERKKMVNAVRQRLDVLEELTEPLWGYGAEYDGWKQVTDYIATKK